MELQHYLYGVIVGWGSFYITLIIEYLRDPHPPDLPKSWLQRGISAVGGVVGVFLINQFFPKEVSLITVSLGAFFMALIFSDLLNLILPKRKVS